MDIRGKTALLERVSFELKYKFGFTYLDKCGRILNAIMRDRPEWALRGSASSPQATALFSMENGCTFNFSAESVVLTIERPSGGEPLKPSEVDRFAEQVDFVSRVVIDQLGINEFTRIGFRCWYLFGCKDSEEAETWLLDLGCYSISPKVAEAFGGSVKNTNFAAIIEGKDRDFRVTLNGVENLAHVDLGSEIMNIRTSMLSKDQGRILREQMKVRRRMLVNPGFAAAIDVDSFQDYPITVDPAEFIKTSILEIETGLNAAVSGR